MSPSKSSKIGSLPLDDKSPVQIVAPKDNMMMGFEGLILVCDHASNAIPPTYKQLGLQGEALSRHIAYDIGILPVAQHLQKFLNCPLVASHFSRLLIDPNRGEQDPTLVMRIADGAVIEGNRFVDAEEIAKRIHQFHRPYHEAIELVISQTLAKGHTPVLISLHSFTHFWKGVPRPWHGGLLWDQDRRLTDALMGELTKEAELVIGDNEPYTGRLAGDCMNQHGTKNGYAHCLVEIRQDLISNEEGQVAWARRLSQALQSIANNPQAVAQLGAI